MAVSQVEERILGQLARQTESFDRSLSDSLFQVLGLSILLSRRLVKARRLRKLDNTRDTKSLQLYHHIIWLAKEGLFTTEFYIVPYCANGEHGPECRVMAAKLRASFYHIYCLFHNTPPLHHLNGGTYQPVSTSPGGNSSRGNNGLTQPSQRKLGKAALRDPIPSMVSEASYITNPYSGQTQTPPPNIPVPPIPADARRTPTRPPGLTASNVRTSPTAAVADFPIPTQNFVPKAQQLFETAQHLASALLSPIHPLRLSVSLEHAAFTRDCVKDQGRARRVARRAIKDVYACNQGLGDEEFAEISMFVRTLGGIVRQKSSDEGSLSRKRSQEQIATSGLGSQRGARTAPPIDRTIAVSPPSTGSNKRSTTGSPSQIRSLLKTPERLATVPEVESMEPTPHQPSPTRSSPRRHQHQQRSSPQHQPPSSTSPPTSRLSSRSGGNINHHSHNQSAGSPTRSTSRHARSTSSTPSERSSKRRAIDSSEAPSRAPPSASRSSPSSRESNASGTSPSGRCSSSPSKNASPSKRHHSDEGGRNRSRKESSAREERDKEKNGDRTRRRKTEKREAIHKALDIISPSLRM